MQYKRFRFGFMVLAVALVVGWCGVAPAVGADKPVWRILWAILPEVDYVHTDGSVFRLGMDNRDLQVAKEMAQRSQRFLQEAVGDVVEFDMTIITSQLPVTHLSMVDEALSVAYDDLPADIAQAISRSVQAHQAYHQLIATVRLIGIDEHPHVSARFGITTDTYSCNYLEPYDFMDYYDHAVCPELDWIHELLHGIIHYFQSKGYAMADLHQPADYGFPGLDGYGSDGNEEFYRAFLAGNLYDASGQQVGVTADMWTLAGQTDDPDRPDTPSQPDSPNSPHTPTPNSSPSSDSGGGGCDTGIAVLALLTVAGLFVRKQR